MSVKTQLNTKQKIRLEKLIWDIKDNEELPIEKIQEEFKVSFNAAKNLMSDYVNRGLVHYNADKKSYLPNKL